jgi:NAD+ kinase
MVQTNQISGALPTVKSVGLVVKSAPEAHQKANEFEDWLLSRKIAVIRRDNDELFSHSCFRKDRKQYPPPSSQQKLHAPSGLFCIFVLGGDGTFLSAARWIGNQHIPIIGIKFGEVGFLASVLEAHLFPAAEKILDQCFETECRTRIEIRIIRNKRVLLQQTALNDVVINKAALARLANLETYIDQQYLTTFRSDGLIVATPTGSTAYSLSAGGPVIYPSVPGIILTPICPFTLTNRPLIVSDSARIMIKLADHAEDMLLTLDGQECFDLQSDDTILVQKAEHPVSMIILPGYNYFEVLKTKLRWSGGSF